MQVERAEPPVEMVQGAVPVATAGQAGGKVVLAAMAGGSYEIHSRCNRCQSGMTGTRHHRLRRRNRDHTRICSSPRKCTPGLEVAVLAAEVAAVEMVDREEPSQEEMKVASTAKAEEHWATVVVVAVVVEVNWGVRVADSEVAMAGSAVTVDHLEDSSRSYKSQGSVRELGFRHPRGRRSMQRAQRMWHWWCHLRL